MIARRALVMAAGVVLLGAAPAAGETRSFSEPSSINIGTEGQGSGKASPFPSPISAEGLCGNVTDVTVLLNGITHQYLRDVDVLLVGPRGQHSIVMSDAGSEADGAPAGVTNRLYAFSDTAPARMSPGVTPAQGTYRPTNIAGADEDEADIFPGSPAPQGPHPDTFSVFDGTNPNGIWRLYVWDDELQFGGVISAGWVLTLTTDRDAPCPPASGNAPAATTFAPATLPTVVDSTKPMLGSFGLSSSAFRAASAGSAFSAQKKRRRSRAPTGTRVSFTLSETSTVRFTVQRKTTGRRVSGRCRASTRRNRTKPQCTLWKDVTGSFTIAGKSGRNSFKFRGRIGGRSLKPGTYRLSGSATDPARNVSATTRKGFRIVR